MVPKPQQKSSLGQESLEGPISGETIVISGIAGLYPSCNNVKDLSNILYNKVNPITNNPRWKYNHPEVPQYIGKIPGLERFDAQFFKVHYRQALNMDPMSRKVLEQAYAAIYDAGMSPEHLSGKKIGVYIGACFSEAEKACTYVSDLKFGFGITGCSKSMFANRISYWLNAKGPSITIDESCSSSIAAIECAYQAILRGDCEAAIVGGTNVCLHPQSSVHYGRLMQLSKDNKTRSFDSKAAGCVRSEAINVIFLQKAKDAYRIYAEIVHVRNEINAAMETKIEPKFGFNRDPVTIARFLKKFYEEAKIQPNVVQYVEAFGSADLEADKSELEALDKVFCKNRKNPLLVGSVTSNVGYGEAASGLSALIKVLLGYHNGKIAANLNYDSPRQDVEALQEGRLKIVAENEKFDNTYSAVNSLAVTGLNAHLLLRGYDKPKNLLRYKSNIPQLVLMSARQESTVKEIFNDIKNRIIDPEEIALINNIHGTKISGHLGRGFMMLDENEEQQTVCLREVFNYFDEAKRPVWFVYSGMGSQWAGMGAQLMRIPVFAAAIERCRQVLEPKGIDIVHIITSPDKTIFNNILHSFVGIAAIQIGLTDILRTVNIHPDKIIGHSVGELGCAYADGCFTAEEMILSAYWRGRVSVETPFIRGSMAAIGLGYEKISKLCPPEIVVACHNGPHSSTISGPADIMKEFVTKLTEKGVFAKEVPCSNIAYHSRYIAEAGPGLFKYLSEVLKSPKPRSDRWLSTSVPQDRWNEPIAKYSSAEYHTNNLLNSVLFEETSRLIPSNALLVEIAPHGLLQAILKRSLPESCRNIPLTNRGHPDNAKFLLEAIGKLYMEGCLPKVSALYPKVEFPVSTGTPMLSHLVRWVHHEKWYIPLYATANRKFASACVHVLSVHDDENEYLSGHVIRGKNVYPFAATLVAVWDTLAMSLGAELKKLPVVFQNVHLHSQPLLHDRRQLYLSVEVHRGTGRFEVRDEMVIVANGYIKQIHDLHTKEIEHSNTTENDVTNLDSQEIYQLLHARDYEYKNAFRSIFTVNSTLSSSEIIWNNNWVTLIDGMLQFNVLKTNHESVSQPNFIKNMSIDVDKHQSECYEVNGEVVLKAHTFDLHKSTRCGGIVIENIQFLDLPPLKDEIALQSLQFVPFFPIVSNMNESSALSVFIQIVAENINKKQINILELVYDENSSSKYDYIIHVLNTLPEFGGSYSKINIKKIHENQITSITDVDVLLITNLEKDEHMRQKLYQVLQQDTFIINREDYNRSSNTKPSVLYRTISSHNINAIKTELLLWRPSRMPISSVLTVSSSSDLKFLSSKLNELPLNQKMVVVSSTPPVPGLKSLVQRYRTKFSRKVNLIIINQEESSEEQYLNCTEQCDLAFAIVQHGIWGGEYIIPVERTLDLDKNVVLKTGRIADLDSLYWEEAAEPVGPGVPIKVHYAGINIVDVNRQLGITNLYNNDKQTDSVIDFSGTTTSGARVMGITHAEGISSSLKANPNLLWPIPAHWSLEDAATVPLAYCMAFYMLCIKSQLRPNFRVLVHGGAGALGQAVISIALHLNCEVFTTVSDDKKKRFLQKLFPKLKAAYIGNSRDISFGDLVLSATKGVKCDVVIICSKGGAKATSMSCCGSRGIIFDTAHIHNRENFDFGMENLTEERSYVTVNFESIFLPQYTEDMKRLQVFLSEGIACGSVRPLSRLTFATQEVSRAFRLVATSRHKGRVLLDFRQITQAPYSRLFSSPHLHQLIWSDNELMGIKLVDKLISQGAKKIILYLKKIGNSVLYKLRFWQINGVEVKVFTESSSNIKSLLKYKETFGQIDSEFIIVSDPIAAENELFLKNVSVIASNTSPRFSAMIRSNVTCDQKLNKVDKQYGVMNIYLPPIKLMNSVFHAKDGAISINTALDAIAKARNYKESTVHVHAVKGPHQTLLQKVLTIANLEISKDVPSEVTLKELNMDASKISAIHAYLRSTCDIYISEEQIPFLSIQSINDLEEHQRDLSFVDHDGLRTLFSYVDHDELLATTEMLFLRTLTNNSSMRDDEFSENESYLCVVPGVEGLHLRFSDMCVRLKLRALVLQPGLDNLQETVQEVAKRFAKSLLEKIDLKKKFYLLGYETGIMVALEMAAILEDRGLTGTVFCVGGSPDEILGVVKEKLQHLNTDIALQEAIIKHMVRLLVDDYPESLEDALKNCGTWNERVDACVKSTHGRIQLSKQYTKKIIEAAYARVVQLRKYEAEPRALNSTLISIRPNYLFQSNSYKSSLHNYSKKPIITYQLEAPLAYATQDLRCATIINRHIDKEILNDFCKRNLCYSYLINPDAFVTDRTVE